MSGEIEEPFKKKVDSIWFRCQDKPETQAENPLSLKKYSSITNALSSETFRRAASVWVSKLQPTEMLHYVRYFQFFTALFMERVRSDDMRLMQEKWLQNGGWKSILRDLKKAEKAILEVYGLEGE